ncbi:hypothetical protein, conserved [Babesia bigemina]|uniref:Uncharacterized protein n=1 Tax=Babesia bigemina TaxID=5866 RepID=A0A061DE29_BABBI|nr:hypothetical protein, conserved [Babesia bigemina]CDR96785.1 hypothetical protein, conserved [Babesia bigemina]|eukprot:XP_012768971.1 hypothetical protein, conserved [Babesia bigemina]
MAFNYTKALVVSGKRNLLRPHCTSTLGAAAALAYVVYYFIKEANDEEEEEGDLYKGESRTILSKPSANLEGMTRMDVLNLLKKIMQSQEKAKTMLRSLVQEIIDNDFSETVDGLYRRIVNDVPVDPLKSKGLTLLDLDYLVERYQGDYEIRTQIIEMISQPAAEQEEDDVDIPSEVVISIYEYMLAELQGLQTRQQPMTTLPDLNVSAASLAVQAIIAAKVQKKFGYTPVQVDRSVTRNQAELGMSNKFARLAIQIQSEMTDLTG